MMDTDTLELVRTAATAIVDTKAFALNGYDVGGLTSYTDAFLIASTSSDRHLSAVADRVERSLRSVGRKSLHREGSPAGGWILIDYGEFIVHLFTEQRRGYYNLDSLWGDAASIDLDDLQVAPDGPSPQ
jgi:ribosome-associated protein